MMVMMLPLLAMMLLTAPDRVRASSEVLDTWNESDADFSLHSRGSSADFSADGNWLVYVTSNPGDPDIVTTAIRINVVDASPDDPADWETVAVFRPEAEGGGSVIGLAFDVTFHPQHDAFVVGWNAGGGDGIGFYDITSSDPEDWEQVQIGDITLQPQQRANSMRFSPDGEYLAVGIEFFGVEDDFQPLWEVFETSDPDPRNWDFADVVSAFSPESALPGDPQDIAFSPDRDMLVYVHRSYALSDAPDGTERYATIINSSGDEWFFTFNHPEISDVGHGVDFHPDGDVFAIGWQGGIRVFDTETLDIVNDFDLGGVRALSTRFSPDGTRLAAGTLDPDGDQRMVWVDTSADDPSDWSVSDEIGPTTLPSEGRTVEFSPDGEFVAVAHRLEPFGTVFQRTRAPSVPNFPFALYVPGSLDLVLDTGEVNVSWQAPDDDGGRGLDRYEIRSPDGAFSTVSVDPEETHEIVTFTYSELDDPLGVPVEIVAVGETGLESPVAMAGASLPQAPAEVTDAELGQPTASDQGVTWTVSWQPPLYDGGAPITGYRVRTEQADGGQNLFPTEETSIDVEFGLDGGEVSIAAENEMGEGQRVFLFVPSLTGPDAPQPPEFVAARRSGSEAFEIDVQAQAPSSWGTAGGSELEPGEFQLSYQGVTETYTATVDAGDGAETWLMTLVVPGVELVDGQSVELQAINELGLASSTSVSELPVFEAGIASLAGLTASDPVWDEAQQAYSTEVSWSEYDPFADSNMALALLEGGERPTGTTTVAVGNSPPVVTETGSGAVDVVLDNAEAPTFGEAEAVVTVEGLGEEPQVSAESTTAVTTVEPPPAPSVALTGQRFSGSVLEHDLTVQADTEHAAPIVDVDIVAADDGVTVELEDDGDGVFIGMMSVDLDSADYTGPVVGEQHPAADLRLVDGATLSGDSALAETPAVPAPEPVAILDTEVSFESWEATIQLELTIGDLESAGPTEEFIVTVDGTPAQVQSESGSNDEPIIEIEAEAGELLSDTVVTVARRSIVGELSEPAEITIDAAEIGLSLEKELTDAPEMIEVGSELEYTLIARNVGEVALVDVEVFDEMITPDGASCDELAPEASCELVGTYTVTQDDVDAGEVINTGSAQGQAADGQTVEAEEATVQTPVEGESSMAMEKVLENSASFVEVGETLSYTVTVTNTGAVTLTDVLVSDDMISPSSEQCSHLAPGDHCVLSGEYVVTEADAEEGFIVNQAVAEADGLEEVSAEHIIAVGEGIFEDRFSTQ